MACGCEPRTAARLASCEAVYPLIVTNLNVITIVQRQLRPWKLPVGEDHLPRLAIWSTLIPCNVDFEMDVGA